MTKTDFNDMLQDATKADAFAHINSIVNAGIAQLQTGNTVAERKPSKGEKAKKKAASNDSGTKIAPDAARGAGGGGDDVWRVLLLYKNGALQDCRENVYLMLSHHPAWQGVLHADEFARKIVKRKPAPWETEASFKYGAEWSDDDDLRLGMWLAQQEGLLVRNAANLTAAIGWCAREHVCHPVREYLDDLSWDGISRIDDWLTDFVGVKKTEYTQLAGRFFLIGMVARIYQPGCAMRFMPIFEGKQYRGKSTAFRILGGEWFADTPLDLNNKDTYQLIQGVWIYEIAELDAFNRAESTRIKAFISSPKDRFRAPYDRSPRDWLRSTVFGGTTNQDEYFKDTTGNTRYWPLRAEEVDDINLEGLTHARDQLFAEALHLYRKGERWHPTREEQSRLFEPEQASREILDPWEEKIAFWLSVTAPKKVTVLEILVDCLKIDEGRIDGAKQMSQRVGYVMRRIGWHRTRATSGAREWFYVQPDDWKTQPTVSGVDDEKPF